MLAVFKIAAKDTASAYRTDIICKHLAAIHPKHMILHLSVRCRQFCSNISVCFPLHQQRLVELFQNTTQAGLTAISPSKFLAQQPLRKVIHYCLCLRVCRHTGGPAVIKDIAEAAAFAAKMAVCNWECLTSKSHLQNSVKCLNPAHL